MGPEKLKLKRMAGTFLVIQWLGSALPLQGHRFNPCLGNTPVLWCWVGVDKKKRAEPGFEARILILDHCVILCAVEQTVTKMSKVLFSGKVFCQS